MTQEESNENPLAGISGKAGEEAGQKGEGVADATNEAKPATEEAPQSEIEFFRKLFFRK